MGGIMYLLQLGEYAGNPGQANAKFALGKG